ncbi:rCG59737, isoform CRA_b, partial [Rattus norvegicus]
MPGPQGGTG